MELFAVEPVTILALKHELDQIETIMNIKGSNTALVTPFKNGVIDELRYQDFIEWQISAGTHGLVPVGTTGESATLSEEEHKRVITLCVEAANGLSLIHI